MSDDSPLVRGDPVPRGPNRRGTGPLVSPLTWQRWRENSAIPRRRGTRLSPRRRGTRSGACESPPKHEAEYQSPHRLDKDSKYRCASISLLDLNNLPSGVTKKRSRSPLLEPVFRTLYFTCHPLGSSRNSICPFRRPLLPSLYGKNTIKYTESCVQLYTIE